MSDRNGEEILRIGALQVRPGRFACLPNGRVVALTVRELSLLTELARRAGTVVDRDELHRAVWGEPLRLGDRSIDVYVSRLRRKLATEMPGWRLIHTHSGFGYRLAPEREGGLSHLFHIPATRQ